MTTPPALAFHHELRGRVLAALPHAPVGLLVLAGPENVGYVTGYRSLAETMRRDPVIVAAVAPDGSLTLVAPAADIPQLVHDGYVHPEQLIPYGRFYVESPEGAPASRAADVHPGLVEALRTLLDRQRPGVELGADGLGRLLLHGAAPGRPVWDASEWMLGIRACKTEAEVARLERAAHLVEDAIDRSLELVRPGATERDLALQIAGDLAAGGASPRFVVVTAGERAALSDAVATTRAIRPGDLVRFDIGCVLDHYWADLGRTVVVGPPSAAQSARYAAILAGEQAQLDAARPGATAAELFELAVRTVESEGLAPYRRHHCGHAIGSEVYERPVVAPGWDDPLAPGMTFCFETPYYELGWGGMMVEDTVVITDDGCRMLNRSDRSLREV